MANCPKCGISLQTVRQREGIYYSCNQCQGRAMTLPQIHRMSGDRFASGLVRKMNTATQESLRPCPFCFTRMKLFEISDPPITLESCRPCTAIWFDAGKFEILPDGVVESPDSLLLTAAELEAKRRMQQSNSLGEDVLSDPPDEDWKWIPAFLGFPVKFHNAETSDWPWITWSLSALIALISICAFFNLDAAVQNFGMIPAEAWRYGGATLITSFFLHAGILHLVGNLYFFLLFGGEVEDYLGRWRFLALIFLSTLIGHFVHILGNPHSLVPCIGASGGISGVLVFYALQFPHARLGFFWWRFGWVRLPAWSAFILWFLLQIVGAFEQIAGFSNVSSLAHLGGVTTGFVLWLWWRKIGQKNTQTDAPDSLQL
jgi:membrane associated rhomboid family serine protease/Zn-finger nucleic acid-binding protein